MTKIKPPIWDTCPCEDCKRVALETARRRPFEIVLHVAIPKILVGAFFIILSLFLPILQKTVFLVGGFVAMTAYPDMADARRIRRENIVREVMLP